MAKIILSMILMFIIGVLNLAKAESEDSSELDFAFMRFRSYLEGDNGSRHREEALFAVGEYYFWKAAYHDASATFLKLLDEYPDSKSRLFVLMYLLKIAEKTQQETAMKEIRNEIISFKQLILLFKDFKKYEFESPLGKRHKAIYYIDKVEFFVDGELFAKITY